MIVSGKITQKVIKGLVWTILKLAVAYFKSPFKAISVTLKMISMRRKVYGNKHILKFAYNGERYFHTSDIPGWPSKAYDEYTIGEFKRITKKNIFERPLQTVILSITSQCPLACKHCFESEYLGTGKQLSLQDLKKIMDELYQNGLRHIQLSGGEPLTRFVDLLELLNYHPDIEYWLLTSGFGLTEEKALQLKKAGLTGMHISLDHYQESKHNEFRGNAHSFRHVMQAVEYCQKAQILVSLSLTATAEFVTQDSIAEYLKLAKNLKVDFVRMLESRDVGRYKGKNIPLADQQIAILENVYLQSLSDKKSTEAPIIDFPGYHQRCSGCFGGGNRYLYIDSDGNYHACPFCQHKSGNVINTDLSQARILLQTKKCHEFQASGY